MSYKSDSELFPGSGIFSNPGAGPVHGEASPEGAAYNMAVLVQDIIDLGGTVSELSPIIGDASEMEGKLMMGGTLYSAEHDGRFPFRITVDGKRHLLEMPGLHIDDVRFMDRSDQNIWDFPRLFIDGSSWIWSIALRVLHDDDETQTGHYGEYLED